MKVAVVCLFVMISLTALRSQHEKHKKMGETEQWPNDFQTFCFVSSPWSVEPVSLCCPGWP